MDKISLNKLINRLVVEKHDWIVDCKYEDLKNLIKKIEYELEKWNDSGTSVERGVFGPFYTQEDLLKYKKELEEFDMSFIAPRKYE